MAALDASLDAVFGRGLFDPDWYAATYPDVRDLRLDPEHHYRRYGHAMGRAPGPEAAADSDLAIALLRAPPPEFGELQAADAICRTGATRQGLFFAELHATSASSAAIDLLRANAALAAGDESGWLACLNRYLTTRGAGAVMLGGGASLIDRFIGTASEAVTSGPKVSVLMPARNAEDTLVAAATSILNQSWRNLELLIVDDASTDATGAVIQELARRDPRVKAFSSPVSVGPYVCKNILLEVAQGAWITGHDADDWAHPQRLEAHMGAVLQEATAPPASLTHMLRLAPDGRFVRIGARSEFSPDGVLRLASVTCLYQADFLKRRLGGWDNVRFAADSELIARAKRLIGGAFRTYEQVSMLCLDLESSLTNDPAYGVDQMGRLSSVRRIYSDAWAAWHGSFAQDSSAGELPFPPGPGERRFRAGDEMTVPLDEILRSRAAVLDQHASDGAARSL
ncbi:glycosyltransferase family 2 protein [Brevundimonas sp. VNH65]|uniref:glycosyltransferase family 2 protein n=1 Tax=Brevundimonas sp. VNH65 TaxID=3400917 RepID=UPI003C0A577F